MSEKKEKVLLPRKPTECQPALSDHIVHWKGRPTKYYDALPRDFEFAYMTPSYYATGFAIFDVYKTEFDFSEYRKLLFLQDPALQHKWGILKKRIPYPESRITDLPGTRKVNYHNYCLRNIMPETAKSWRKSIIQVKPAKRDLKIEEKDELEAECVCKE